MSEKLPKGWLETTLGEIRFDGSIAISQEQMRGETFELYSVPAFSEGKPEIVPGDEIGSNKVLVSPGDVLLCKINPRINRAWVVGETTGYRQIASTEWIIFSKIDGISPDFLCYFFSQDTFRDFLASNVSGVGGSLMRVRPSIVEKYPINLPPFAEQERIVAKLNNALARVQRAEKAARRAYGRLDNYRSTVLNFAVTGELTRKWRESQQISARTDVAKGEELLKILLTARRARWEKVELQRLKAAGKDPKDDRWKSRYPQATMPDMTDLTDLPEVPNEWSWASLDMIAEIGSGISVSQNRKVKKPVELPYLRVANVLRGHLDLSEIKTIRVEKDQVAK